MQSSPRVYEHQLTRDMVPSYSGATPLNRGILLVFAVLFVGWTAALASLYVYGAKTGEFGSEAAAIFAGDVPSNVFLVVAAVAAILPLLILLIWRGQAVRRKVYRTSSGCPNCHERDFIRVRRQSKQRLASKLLWLPAEAHACRNCSWQGLLLGVDGLATYAAELSREERSKGAVVIAERKASEVFPARTNTGAVKLTRTTAKPLETPKTAVPDPQPAPAADAGSTAKKNAETAARTPTPAPTQKPTPAPTKTPTRTPTPTPTPARAPAPPPDADERDIALINGYRNPAFFSAAVVRSHGSKAADEAPEQEKVQKAPQVRSYEQSVKKPGKKVHDLGRGLPQAVVTAPFGIKLLREPRSDAEVLMRVPANALVRILDCEEDKASTTWQYVVTESEGTTGWVSSAFLKRLPRSDSS